MSKQLSENDSEDDDCEYCESYIVLYFHINPLSNLKLINKKYVQQKQKVLIYPITHFFSILFFTFSFAANKSIQYY